MEPADAVSEAVLDTVDALVVVVGTDGLVQLFNSGCEELTGRTADDVVGQPIFELGLIPPDELDGTRAVFERLVAGAARVDHENDWIGTGGERRRIAWRNTRLTDAQGRVTHVIATGIDLTLRMALRRRLSLVSEELEGALAAFGDRVLRFASDGTILEVTAHPDTEWYLDQTRLVGSRMRDLFPDGLGLEYEEAIRRCIAQQETSLLEYELPFPAGTRHFESRIAPLSNGQVLAVIRDVTATVALARQLSLARMHEATGRMASGIAHDINNLLTAVALNLDGLETDVADDDRALTRIERIRAVLERSSRLVDDLFTLARGHRPAITVFDLAHHLRELAPVLADVAGSDRALSVDARAPVEVAFNERALDQVVVNLVTNARDATASGGRILVAATHGPQGPILTVTDDGVGMDAATLEQAFVPFFTTKGPGRTGGLGLATTDALVRQLGGEVTLASAPGQGTAVTVRLPAPTEPATDRPDPAAVTSTGVVLVLDDDAEMAALIGEVLTAGGHTTEAATDLPQALARIDVRIPPVRLVVSDLVLNLGFGTDLLPALEARGLRLPVVFVSGSGDPQVLDLVPDHCPLLAKPFARTDLLAAVAHALGSGTLRA